jgi:hypothetical protein
MALSRRFLELLHSESLGLESLAWGDLPRGVLRLAWSLQPFHEVRCLVSCGNPGADDGLSRFVFPKASRLPEHGNDARLLHRDLLFARAALRQWRRRGPRTTIPRNGGIRKAERAVGRRRNDLLFCFQSENKGIFCGAWTKITNS